MTDTERLDSLANLLYRAQWDRENVSALNEVIDGMMSDQGYAPGVRFRQLLDKHVGDHRPSVSTGSRSDIEGSS